MSGFLPPAEAVRAYRHLLGRPGFFAQSDGKGKVRVAPWEESATRGHQRDGSLTTADPTIPVPEHIIQQARSSLPSIRRRTPEERLKAMTDVLIADAKRAFEATGMAALPNSVVEDICRIYALEFGRIISPETVRRMTFEQLRPHLERKAKADFTKAGHQQADSDRRKVALDWHGAYNHKAVTR